MGGLAIMVMAAGASKRLGRPKQLLPYKNTTLLNHTIRICLDAKLGPVYVVLGARKEEIKKTIDLELCTALDYVGYDDGLSSSIAFGVNQINDPNLKGILVVLADQVFLTKEVLQDLAAKANQGAPLINCKYLVGSGPPSYFDRCYFEELESLQGDNGAKSIIQKNVDDLVSIAFPQGHVDIDIPEDLTLLDL